MRHNSHSGGSGHINKKSDHNILYGQSQYK